MQAAFDIPTDLDTPVSAFLKLRPLGPRFLLESALGVPSRARFSFLGFGPMNELRMDASCLSQNARRRALPESPAELLFALRRALRTAPLLGPRIDGVPFHGGLVGVCGYALARRLAGLGVGRRGAGGEPELALMAPSAVLVFDHLTRRVALLSDADAAQHAALKREVVDALRAPLALPEQSRGSFEAPRAELSAAEFTERFTRIQAAIRDGDVYQLVLSNRFVGAAELDPFSVYRALRRLNPSPYMFFFDFGAEQVIGASPEAMARLDGRHATLQPIAGTRARGADEEQDHRLERALLDDPKEAAEHVMLVDLARNDLGAVAVPGTIRVEPYRNVERFSHVMHLVSGVTGTLEPERDLFDLFAACFPAGTVVGAPKLSAMERIQELEPSGRGLYAGAAGYFGHGSTMDQAIAIRTLVLRDGKYSYQAGAGIVADSRADHEYAEILAKSGAMRAALELAAEGL